MNNIQDARDAQQMWEYRFKNAGREGVALRIGKSRGIWARMVCIVSRVTGKSATSNRNLSDSYQPV